MGRECHDSLRSRQPLSKLVQETSVVVAFHRQAGEACAMNNAGNVIAANLQTRIEWLLFYFTAKKALFQAYILEPPSRARDTLHSSC